MCHFGTIPLPVCKFQPNRASSPSVISGFFCIGPLWNTYFPCIWTLPYILSIVMFMIQAKGFQNQIIFINQTKGRKQDWHFSQVSHRFWSWLCRVKQLFVCFGYCKITGCPTKLLMLYFPQFHSSLVNTSKITIYFI